MHQAPKWLLSCCRGAQRKARQAEQLQAWNRARSLQNEIKCSYLLNYRRPRILYCFSLSVTLMGLLFVLWIESCPKRAKAFILSIFSTVWTDLSIFATLEHQSALSSSRVLKVSHKVSPFYSISTFCNRISIICNQIDVIMLHGNCHSPILLTAVAVRDKEQAADLWGLFTHSQRCPVALYCCTTPILES